MKKLLVLLLLLGCFSSANSRRLMGYVGSIATTLNSDVITCNTLYVGTANVTNTSITNLTVLNNANVIGTVSASALQVNGVAVAVASNFQPVPITQWSDFDAASPYLIYGVLWVGWDSVAKAWKYTKQASGRGLADPGNPTTWTVNGTTIGYFDGSLIELPSGTHLNNRYHPKMMAYKCGQDDIQIKIGSMWADKYANRIVDVGSNYAGTTLKDDAADMQVSGQTTSPYWMAFSQKAQASTGMTWFIAQISANNAGKRLPANEEWQAAAMGTARSAGNTVVNGDSWASVTDQDMSRYGCVGMAGNIWEWVGTWWQSGIKTTTFAQGEAAAAWGANYGDDYTWNVNGSAYTSDAGKGWTNNLPSALLRGGSWVVGTYVGVFALLASHAPSYWYSDFGVRAFR